MANIISLNQSAFKTTKKKNNREIDIYIYGNTVLKPDQNQETSESVDSKNKSKAKPVIQSSVNLGYLIFMTLAMIITVSICVNYIKIKTQYISMQKKEVTLESKYNAIRLENDNDYDKAVNSIDVSKVKKIAMEEYGMDYPRENQIVTYKKPSHDYVKQYCDVP